ncbi:glycosyltransferase [Cryomorphaceae bacterium]|nr:glycosyltransferase [Cryomorphaceae bacterium]
MTLLALSILILGIYDFHFYRSLRSEPLVREPEQWPPISILTCARDVREDLLRLTARWPEQSYPAPVQWVVVDDGAFMPADWSPQLPRDWTFTHVRLEEKELPGKKGAVLAGWSHVEHDFIMSIDADCEPVHEDWLREMVRPLAEGRPAVLGYGDYRLGRGMLGRLIQLETVQTAMLYLSSARRAKPYMAVGRNWGYRRWEGMEDDLRRDADILSGDDSLLLHRRKPKEVGLRWNAAAHTISDPPKSFGEWLRQKSRHAQAGTRFRTGPLLYIWTWHLAQALFFFSIGALLLGDGHPVTAAFLVVSYVLVSTLLRYPFYKALGKTSLLWWRWYYEPILLGFMFLWGLRSLRPRKTWSDRA